MSIMLCDTDSIYFVFGDLTSPDKRALLARTDSGPRALPQLEAMRDRLAAVVGGGKPFTAELQAADRRHDLGCMALDAILRAHELLGALPEHAALAARARTVRDTLTLDRTLTNASYVETATTATRNRNALPDCQGALRQIRVTDDLTAADVAEIFIGGGEEAGRWLARRADVEAAAQHAKAVANGRTLINAARELLVRLRSTIEGEVSWRDDLPDALPGQIFAALDARIAAAVAASRGNRESGVGRDAVAELDAQQAAEQAAAAEAEVEAVDTAPPAAAEVPADDGRAESPVFIPR